MWTHSKRDIYLNNDWGSWTGLLFSPYRVCWLDYIYCLDSMLISLFTCTDEETWRRGTVWTSLVPLFVWVHDDPTNPCGTQTGAQVITIHLWSQGQISSDEGHACPWLSHKGECIKVLKIEKVFFCVWRIFVFDIVKTLKFVSILWYWAFFYGVFFFFFLLLDL